MTELPRGWAAVTLEDVAFWSSGGTPSRKRADYFGGGIPWVKTGELTGKYIRNTEETLTDLGVKNSSAKVFPIGSVGIAMYGATIGKVSIWAIEASTNQACAVAQPFADVISSEFLYHFMHSEKDALVKQGKGGAQPNISQGILKEWPIALPPTNEQRRIVSRVEALFDEIGKGVESLRTAKTTLGLYRQSLLKSAFEGRLTAGWRAQNADKLESPETLLARIQAERETRYKAALEAWQEALANWREGGEKGKKPAKPKRPADFDAPTDVELSRLPELPEEWAISQVNELSAHITSGSRDWKTHYGRGSSVFVMAQNVRAGRYDASTKHIIDPPNDSLSADRTRVAKNDLLITIVGANTGNVCVFPYSRKDHYVCQSVALVRLYNPMYARYLNFYFQDDSSGKKILDYYIYGAGRPHLGFEELKRTLVPICSPAEQAEIVRMLDARLEAASALEVEIDAALTRADALRQSILKKAFSGRLVPQDPTDEPASALLARIKAERAKAPKPPRKRKAIA
ncbi:restriction endonuclease subunit S [Antarcticimicrobium sediminis]|uniref:Type I restriction modification DNA specificity domain-containing protein n=1 Tax=Antarcticimicrobium sediminis TaxID=2546227 RepID=A0A4R5EP96_9RHOB|nr:restriction endonuclease subunit S [Antarcticimicrobium sediminis]TDE36323.1 hypothetical protein E1B25_15555 [Antarcticimicrobium sediminis]